MICWSIALCPLFSRSRAGQETLHPGCVWCQIATQRAEGKEGVTACSPSPESRHPFPSIDDMLDRRNGAFVFSLLSMHGAVVASSQGEGQAEYMFKSS